MTGCSDPLRRPASRRRRPDQPVVPEEPGLHVVADREQLLVDVVVEASREDLQVRVSGGHREDVAEAVLRAVDQALIGIHPGDESLVLVRAELRLDVGYARLELRELLGDLLELRLNGGECG